MKTSTLKYILRYLSKYKYQTMLMFVALLCTSSAVMLLGVGLRSLIDDGLQNSIESLTRILMVMGGGAVFFAVMSAMRSYLIYTIAEYVIADIRNDIYKNLIMLSPSFFEINKVSNIISSLTNDTTLLSSTIANIVSVSMRNVILLIGSLVMLISIDYILILYIAIIAPIVIIPILFLGRKVRNLSRITQDKVATIANHIDESINGLKTVQSFCRERLEIEHFIGKVNDVLSSTKNRLLIRSLLIMTVIALVFLSVIVILWLGGHKVISGEMTPGELSAFLFYSILAASNVATLSESFSEFQKAMGAADRMVELLCAKSHEDRHSYEDVDINALEGGVEFSNVNFSYPSKPGILALDDVSLSIESGQKVAFVGPSGAGKSTIFQLLLRFYEFNKGSISIDGINIKDMKLSDLRGIFAIVPQDVTIFSTTIYDNIAYALPEASEEDVKRVADMSMCTEFIEKLPQGFNTYLGEKGVRISGGQKQRIAIARALLRNPKILLLDEATSHLDTENERLVQIAVDRVMQGRTTLIIAHRLSTVRSADKIVVMDNGQVEAIDIHDQLKETSEIYHNLYNLS